MTKAHLDRIRDKPEHGLTLLIVVQFCLWSLAPMMSHSAPPLDVVEMYAWGREGVVATYKHPNLPGLVLEAIRRLTGQAGWPAFIVSQIFICATFWAVFALGRALMDSRRALAGTLMLTGIYFFSWPSPEFNHNVAQMPLWALTSLFLWRAANSKGALNWALLGLAAGVSIWAKYSSLMLLASAGLWLLTDKDARRLLMTPGPYLALFIFAALAAPQIVWLRDHQFAPFTYAAERAGDGGVLPTLEFLFLEIANHLPLVILLACAGWFGRKAPDAPAAPGKRARRFLLLVGLGPLALTLLVGLFGAGLRTSWGAPMFNLIGLLIVAFTPGQFSTARLQRLTIGAGALLMLLPSIYYAHMRYGALFTGKPLKGNWPQDQITRALEAEWRDGTAAAPLRIVAGDIWTAGLIGMKDIQPPSVLIEGDLTKSPWITKERLRRDGVLVVWRDGDPVPAAFKKRPDSDQASITIPFSDYPKAPPLRLRYMMVPPQAD